MKKRDITVSFDCERRFFAHNVNFLLSFYFKVSGNSHYDVLGYNHKKHTHILRINGVTKEDTGVYRCGIRHSKTQLHVIEFQQPADPETTDFPATLNDNIQLTCQFSIYRPTTEAHSRLWNTFATRREKFADVKTHYSVDEQSRFVVLIEYHSNFITCKSGYFEPGTVFETEPQEMADVPGRNTFYKSIGNRFRIAMIILAAIAGISLVSTLTVLFYKNWYLKKHIAKCVLRERIEAMKLNV